MSPGRDADKDVHAAIGKTMRIGDLARHMIVTSSNLATNLLVDLIKVDQAQQMLARHGIRGVELARGVEDDKAFDANFNNRVTANGLVALFRVIHERRGVLQESAREMLDILFQQEFRSGIPAGIPADVRSASRIANKTGEISVAAHDAGLVFLPGREPYVLAVLTEPEPEQRSPHGAHRPRLDRRLRVAHVMSHFPLPIVDGLELDAPVRSLLMPGVPVRDSHARLRRLPRFFYAVESWNVALETQADAAFRDVGVHGRRSVRAGAAAPVSRATCRAPSRRSPRISRCCASRSARRFTSPPTADIDRRRTASRSPGSPHCWGTAANIYRIGDRVSRRARRDRKVRGARDRSAAGAARAAVRAGPGCVDDHVHLDLGYVTAVPADAAGEEVLMRARVRA